MSGEIIVFPRKVTEESVLGKIQDIICFNTSLIEQYDILGGIVRGVVYKHCRKNLYGSEGLFGQCNYREVETDISYIGYLLPYI